MNSVLPSPALDLRDLVRTFANGTVRAVEGVNLTVARGEIVSILGPSGCGKTTLMRMIAGLDGPDSGAIHIHGKNVADLAPHQRDIGLVFQSLAIFPHMNVARNVGFGLRMRRVPAEDIARRVRDVLKLVQLPIGKFGERYPSELSGGQLQRVALARTLVTEPALVLFDEPMAALDRRLRDYMALELRAIQKQLGIAAVYVTHDQETASTMSDRIAVMDAGRIVQVGPPEEIYDNPVSRFVAEFLGDANVLTTSRILDQKAGTVDVEVAGHRRLQARARQGLRDGMLAIFRPRDVQVHPSNPGGMAIEGKLVSSQFNSGVYRWEIAIPGGGAVAAQAYDNRLSGLMPNEAVWISIDPAHVRLVEA